jgi:STE24 endopeptidase
LIHAFPAIRPEPEIELSPAEEALCARYCRTRLLLSLAEIGVLLVLLAGLTLTRTSTSLLALCAVGPGWENHLLYLLLLGCLARTAQFPFQLLGEFWLDRRAGLSHQSLGSWLWEWFCRSVLFAAATVVVLFPVVETLRWWPILALPWCVLFMFGRNLFYDYLYYPLLSLFYPVRFLRYETFPVPGVDRVTLPVYQVQVSHKTRRANAAIRLRGKKTAIYVTDTLIDEFTDGEERVVMAHEFGHLYDHLHLEERTRAGVAQAHRKLMLGSAQLLAGAVSLLALHLTAPLLGLNGVQDLAGFPLLAALTLVLAHLFAPFLCAEARRDERDADEYALAVTGDVENYVSVMRKLRHLNLEESCPSPISRFLFDTHPSYSERVHLAHHYRRRYSRRKKSQHWRGWRGIQRHGRR